MKEILFYYISVWLGTGRNNSTIRPTEEWSENTPPRGVWSRRGSLARNYQVSETEAGNSGLPRTDFAKKLAERRPTCTGGI